jgi:hypothetical protein
MVRLLDNVDSVESELYLAKMKVNYVYRYSSYLALNTVFSVIETNQV